MDDTTNNLTSADQQLVTEDPEQDLTQYPRWEYPERRDPKWGEVTKKGLVVGRGRTQRVVPPDEIFKLAEIGLNDRELAHWFGISESTLRYNFSSYLLKARASLNLKLRRAQLRVALDGNPTMLIWLGRQMLGQSENNFNTEENKPLPWTDDDASESSTAEDSPE